MVVFHHNTTIKLSDKFLNYGYGAALPFCFLVSTALNPIVVLHNARRNQNVSTLLFQLLAVSDFITNIYQPIFMAYLLLMKAISVEEEPTPLHYISTILMAWVKQGSGMLTTLLSITRYIKIKSPFCIVNRKFILLYIAMNFIYFDVGFPVILLTSDECYIDRRVGYVWHDMKKMLDLWACILLAPFAIHSLVAIVTSILTVYCLRNRSELSGTNCNKSMRYQRKSCLTILILNAGNMMLFLCCVTYLFLKYLGKENDVAWSNVYDLILFNLFGFIPIFLSALNPLIITLRSTSMKQLILRKNRIVTSIVLTEAETNTIKNLSTNQDRIFMRSMSAPEKYQAPMDINPR